MAFTGPQPEGTPQTIYKYRYFDSNSYHLRNLVNAELWFTSARTFNDPFDSAIPLDLTGLNSDVAVRWAENFLTREFPHFNPDERRKLAEERIQQMRNDPNDSSWFQEDHIEENYSKFGICSLTPHRDNLLMWAHYAKHHQGFCFGVDTQKLLALQRELAPSILLDLHKVTYSELMPRINFFESMQSPNGDEDLVRLVTTKSTHWEYEHEYRLMLWKHPNTSLPIGFDAINEIILGCRIKPEDKQSILSLLRNLGAGTMQCVSTETVFWFTSATHALPLFPQLCDVRGANVFRTTRVKPAPIVRTLMSVARKCGANVRTTPLKAKVFQAIKGTERFELEFQQIS